MGSRELAAEALGGGLQGWKRDKRQGEGVKSGVVFWEPGILLATERNKEPCTIMFNVLAH